MSTESWFKAGQSAKGKVGVRDADFSTYQAQQAYRAGQKS